MCDYDGGSSSLSSSPSLYVSPSFPKSPVVLYWVQLFYLARRLTVAKDTCSAQAVLYFGGTRWVNIILHGERFIPYGNME